MSVAAPLAGGIPSLQAPEPAPELRGALLTVRCEGLDRLHRVTEILESTGARDVAASLETISEGNVSDRLKTISRTQDSKNREYRDNEGNLHHHTRTFIEQHGTESQVAS